MIWSWVAVVFCFQFTLILRVQSCQGLIPKWSRATFPYWALDSSLCFTSPEDNRKCCSDWYSGICLIPRLEQERYRMKLKYFVIDSKDCSKDGGGMSKRQRRHFEGAPTAQILDNLNNKVIKYKNKLWPITVARINESESTINICKCYYLINKI